MNKTFKLADKKLIIDYYNLGISDSDIAGLIGCDISELYELVEEDKKVRAAKKKGTLKTNVSVVSALLKSAVGYTTKETSVDKRYKQDGKTLINKNTTTTSKEYAPNVTAIKFWLENRDDSWKEVINNVEKKLDITVSVDGKTISVTNNDQID